MKYVLPCRSGCTCCTYTRGGETLHTAAQKLRPDLCTPKKKHMSLYYVYFCRTAVASSCIRTHVNIVLVYLAGRHACTYPRPLVASALAQQRYPFAFSYYSVWNPLCAWAMLSLTVHCGVADCWVCTPASMTPDSRDRTPDTTVTAMATDFQGRGPRKKKQGVTESSTRGIIPFVPCNCWHCTRPHRCKLDTT